MSNQIEFLSSINEVDEKHRDLIQKAAFLSIAESFREPTMMYVKKWGDADYEFGSVFQDRDSTRLMVDNWWELYNPWCFIARESIPDSHK